MMEHLQIYNYLKAPGSKTLINKIKFNIFYENSAKLPYYPKQVGF